MIQYRCGDRDFNSFVMTDPFVTMAEFLDQATSSMARDTDEDASITIEGLTVWWERSSNSQFPASTVVTDSNLHCVLEFLKRGRSDVVEVKSDIVGR